MMNCQDVMMEQAFLCLVYSDRCMLFQGKSQVDIHISSLSNNVMIQCFYF